MSEISEEEGVFQLKTRKDVLVMLKWELEQLRTNPDQTYVAVNFFITADNLVDWTHPGQLRDDAARKKRKKLRNSSNLLRVTFHLAAKAKHFKSLGDQHKSVHETKLTGGSFFGGSFFGGGFFGDAGKLMVVFSGRAAKEFGPSMLAIDLAQRVYEYWEKLC